MKLKTTSPVGLATSGHEFKKNKSNFVSKNLIFLLLANIACVLFVTNTANGQNAVADSLFAINSRLIIPASGATV